MIAVGGPFVACWPDTVAEALRRTGEPCVVPRSRQGERGHWVAFQFVLDLVDAPDAKFVQCIGVQDPDVRRVLLGLADRLGAVFPRRGVRIQADPHECFERIVSDPRWRGVAFADVLHAVDAPPAVLDVVPDDVIDVRAPPHAAYNGVDIFRDLRFSA